MRTFACCVGPYAEWLVPDDGSIDLEPKNDGGEPLYGEHFGRNTRSAPVIEIEGKRFRRVCYWTRAAVSGPPFRAVVIDFTEVDTSREIERFARKHATMLRRLSEHFGSQPVLRWGFVSRYD
jgi:hypothetical protein